MSLESKSSYRSSLNLLFFNIYKFECYTQYLASIPFHGAISGLGLSDAMSRKSQIRDWNGHILQVLNNPQNGVSVHFAARQCAILIGLVLLTILNVVSGIWNFSVSSGWFYGMVVSVILAVALSYIVAPSDSKYYIADFRKFEAMPVSTKRLYALITAAIAIAVVLAFVLSSIFYIRSAIAFKHGFEPPGSSSVGASGL